MVSPACPEGEPLAQVQVATLVRNKQVARLFSNPLGKACYELDHAQAVECLADLRRQRLLEAGLVFASEVRPQEDRHLNSKEWRQFQAEVGCSPLILACLACTAGLRHLREDARIAGDSFSVTKEKEIQSKAGDIVQLLVEHRARISGADVGPCGNTALHVAARGGAPQLLNTLLQLNADVGSRNSDGVSAQILASRAGHRTCEQILQVSAMVEMEKQDAVIRQMMEAESSPTQDQRRRQGAKNKDPKVPETGDHAEERKIEEGPSSAPRPQTKRSRWPMALEEQKPEGWLDDGDLPDEWDVARWGEYHDWGEDWDEDSDTGASDSDMAFCGGDDDELRAEVVRLQKEKTAQLQHLYDLATEREERTHEAEQIERQALRFEERARRLEEREQRMKAGDASALDDTAAEVEVSAWWEERATAHARTVWELEKALARQQKEHAEEVAALEKELRAVKRKTKGLEHYWDHFFDAQSATELLDRITAEQRCQRLSEEIHQLVGSLGLSEDLEELLPPLLVANHATRSASLPPTSELVVALQVHHRLQAFRRELEGQVNELVEFCNKQLSDKDQEIWFAVEQEIVNRVFPEFGLEEDDDEAWQHLADIAAQVREELELSRPVAAGVLSNRQQLPEQPARSGQPLPIVPGRQRRT